MVILLLFQRLKFILNIDNENQLNFYIVFLFFKIKTKVETLEVYLGKLKQFIKI